MPSSILSQKALAIPINVRQSYLLSIPETKLYPHICRLLEKMEAGAECEITHGRDEYGRDIVLRRSSAFGHEYIAIVVKRGDAKGKVTGRSSGPVDEIISQAHQSIAHACYLKEIEVSRVRISAVWVMFFGKLTGNAVRRIVSEAPALKFEPFSIGWLAKVFGEHYPEVFFAGAASNYLQNKVIEFETHHDLTQRPENLSDWYVDPSLAISRIDASTFSKRLKNALNLKRLSYQQFRHELTASKRFVLSAAPGLGKSTLLKKLAADLYREALSDSASFGVNPAKGTLRIPILVSATELASHKDAASFLEAHLPPGEIRDAFSVACLLVDALDEVPQDNQAKLMEFAYELAKSLDCSMVISARPVHVVRGLAGESTLNLPVVQLLPFQYSQAMRLIDRLERDPAIIDILKEGIANLQSHMALSPLSVSLLLDIAKAEREVPGTVGEIFDQYMDIALGRYDIERGIEVVFQYFIKKQLIAELAWAEFFKKDRFTITDEEFDCFLERYFKERGLSEGMLDRMKADIDRSGVLRFSEDVYFAHRSFLDFFIALYVNGHSTEFTNLDKWLAEIYFSDKWSEVSFYVFAQRRELFPNFLSEATLLDNDDVDYHLRRFMIGRLVQAGWLSPSTMKTSIIEFGIDSAPRLFEMISKEMKDDAPLSIPYGVMAGLAEHSYSSRTLYREVSGVINVLSKEASVHNLRSALNLLWANRTRISISDAVVQTDQILDLMAQLEKSGELLLQDKTLGYLMLETIVEGDEKKQRYISRRFRRLLKAQPLTIKKLLAG